jgi:acyl transferase domain-containing protein
MYPSDLDGNTILDAAAKAYAAGQPISWPDLHRRRRCSKIELPGYSFDRKPYWLPAGPAGPAPPSPAQPPALAEPGPGRPGQASGEGGPGGPSVITAAGSERRTAITELIREKVAAVLEFPDIADVAADVDFTDLGMDSLLAVKLRKALCASLSISFPTPEVFSNPSPRALAQFLDEQIGKAR